MAISFQLNLTPNQIQFLQELDLYADGIAEPPDSPQFICWVRKMQREGLVQHVVPLPHQRYKGGNGGDMVIQAYRITDKGKAVLGLIQSDVEAFIGRQREYQAKKKKRA